MTLPMTLAEKIAATLPLAAALLPSNATPLERAMLAAELARLAEVEPEIIATIWDPYRCPAVLLPYLAWALSVDVWDNAWPEIVKRDVIAAAPEVHRHKGTRVAANTALNAMRLRASIKEWWQKTPNGQRGTFDVIVYVLAHVYDPSLPILSEQVQRNAIATLRAVKPKSRSMSFGLGIGFGSKAALADAAACASFESRQVTARPRMRRSSTLGIANRAAAIAVDSRAVIAKPDLSRANSLGLANGAGTIQFQRIKFECRL